MPIDAVSAATETTNVSRARLSENFDTFLTLLTAQLANQDPLNPVDSAAFTQQLVQYSQVEQQIETNEQLKSLLDQAAVSNGAAAVAYIGRNAVLDTDIARLSGGAATWSYDISGAQGDARIVVQDASGRAVYSTAAPAQSGAQTFTWDGKDSAGRALPDGAYRLVVSAEDGDGDAVAPAYSVLETITGIDFSGGSPNLVTTSGARPFNSIRTIRN